MKNIKFWKALATIQTMLSTWLIELKSTLFWRCVIAEFMASTIYCFFATTLMFSVHQDLRSPNNIQNTALALGFLVMVLSHGFGIVHNAFVFPSITFGKCLMKKASLFKSIFAFTSQMIGGLSWNCKSYLFAIKISTLIFEI